MRTELSTRASAKQHPNSASQTMLATIHPRYGAPSVLSLEEIERPSPRDDEVLVRVHAANATRGDHHIVSGKPYLIRVSPFGGLPRPRNRVPGAMMSGRVAAIGAKVTTLRPGDAVFGQVASGAFAEYLTVPAKMLASKPDNLSFEETAAVPWAMTALQGLRAARLQPGQRLLIVGASGGVGTWAVQIARAMGAHVTAVCSTRNLELVRTLGAVEALDYTTRDFLEGGARFDAMLDLVGNRSLLECRRVLLPGGTYVPISDGGGDFIGPLGRLLVGWLSFRFTSRKFRPFVTSPNQADLVSLKGLVESGQARPIIDRRYPLSDVAQALEHVGTGHSRGQTVLRIADE